MLMLVAARAGADVPITTMQAAAAVQAITLKPILAYAMFMSHTYMDHDRPVNQFPKNWISGKPALKARQITGVALMAATFPLDGT
ncbi:hypothetical protein ACWC24_27875 [Streptomyces sp. NPDC001443]